MNVDNLLTHFLNQLKYSFTSAALFLQQSRSAG